MKGKITIRTKFTMGIVERSLKSEFLYKLFQSNLDLLTIQHLHQKKWCLYCKQSRWNDKRFFFVRRCSKIWNYTFDISS